MLRARWWVSILKTHRANSICPRSRRCLFRRQRQRNKRVLIAVCKAGGVALRSAKREGDRRGGVWWRTAERIRAETSAHNPNRHCEERATKQPSRRASARQ